MFVIYTNVSRASFEAFIAFLDSGEGKRLVERNIGRSSQSSHVIGVKAMRHLFLGEIAIGYRQPGQTWVATTVASF